MPLAYPSKSEIGTSHQVELDKPMNCNNPKFWKIEINGFIKIPNLGDNKNFYLEYKINLLSFKTCEFEHLLPCFKYKRV
jgi:hypothetical protein